MANGNVIIRPVATVDLAELSALLVETWHATYDTLYGAARVTGITERWHAVEALLAGLQRLESIDLVAVEQGALLGTACCSWEGEVAKLHRLYVRPVAQGRRIGGQLLERVVGDLRRSPGISSILLEVEPRNAGAIAFYRRHGFVDHGHTGDCGGSGDRIAALIMRRSLAD